MFLALVTPTPIKPTIKIENQIMTEYEMLTLDLVGLIEHTTMRSTKVQLSGSRPK